MEGVKVFIPDKEQVWLPASVQRIEGSVVTVKVEDVETGVPVKGMSLGAAHIGKVSSIDLSKPEVINIIQARTVKSNASGTTISLPLQNKAQMHSNGFEDMISLDHLHEGAILYNLRQRFFATLPYTYTGKICIAVNPYQWLSLYSPQTMQRYMDGSRENKPPHVYAVSMESFFHMRTHNINQSILVSGESGAGKTETTKIMMNHVATLSSHLSDSEAQTSIIHRIIQSNPLLESFGNAATTRNDNSSRFGKFTELQFDPRGRLMGARAHTYLLEKSRVCHQAAGERTFHIFYQVLEAAPSLPHLHLNGNHEYRYVRQDVELALEHTWKDTQEGLSIVGIPNDLQAELLRVLAAILHLGEADFEMVHGDVDSSQVKERTPFANAADLLGLPYAELETVLTHRSVIVGREVIAKPMTVDQARDCRDAVAKSLYSSLFTWLVNQINAAIGVSHVSHFIGILDIFGFEAFVHNSFEQLCINYANEKLQQKFVQDVLKTVQAEYEEEGISWAHVNFADNQDVLDLIEGRLGVLSLLNEESSLATGTDASFAHKLSAVMDNHPRFETPRLQPSAFIILHYAGKVLYDTNGFLDKHRDALLPDIKKVLGDSSLGLVRTMFPPTADVKNSNSYRQTSKSRAGGANASSRAVTVGTQFKESLASLMDKISQTNVHYVRCIKPNSVKSPSVFHHESVVDQLRCAGVIEAIRVSRSAYPSRLPHADCIKNYAILAPALLDASRGKQFTYHPDDLKQLCSDLMAHLFPKGHIIDYQVGLSRVYFRESILDDLEKRRAIALKSHAIRIQKQVKMFITRRRFLRQRRAAIVLQARIRGFIQHTKYRRIYRRIVKMQSVFRSFRARKVVLLLRRARAATRLISAVRMFSQRRQYVERMRAIRTIQTFWRNTLARRKILRRMAQEKKQRALGTKVLHLQTQLGSSGSSRGIGGNSAATSSVMNQEPAQRPSTTSRLFDESSQVLGTLAEENQALRERLTQQETEINLLKEENRKMKESLQAKEVEDKVKNLSQKSHEASQLAYLSLLEEEYEKLRGFVCQLFDLPSDVGKTPLRDDPTPPKIPDLTAAKHEAYTLLHRSATRLQRLRSKENNPKRGSARRVKDYWDEIKTNAPALPYTLGSTPWKRLLTDWAQGNPKKLEYMTKWLQNVLEGGDVEHGGFPLGVELKSVTPMMLEGFIQLVIPKLAERQDVKVHVHTKEFIGTSMRITLEVKEGASKSKKDALPKPQQASARDSMASQASDQWGRNSIMSVRETNMSNFSFASTVSSSTDINRPSSTQGASPPTMQSGRGYPGRGIDAGGGFPFVISTDMFMDDVATNTLRPVKHAGWLRFRGPFGLWTRRFCLCKGDFLHLYKTDDIINGKLKTSIQVWRVDRLDQRWNFRVSDAHGRVMIFQSSDAALFSRWMQVLREIAKENDQDEHDAAMVIPVSSRSLASRPSSFLDKENPALDTSTLFKTSGKASMESPTGKELSISWGNPHHAPHSMEHRMEILMRQWLDEVSSTAPRQAWQTCHPQFYRHTFNGKLHDGVPELFSTAFPRGFGWELSAICSGPPRVAFTWRHWGTFHGTFQGHCGDGRVVELTGFCIVDVDALRLCIYTLDMYCANADALTC